MSEQSQGPVPPVPATSPADPVPPVPRYGEYAPSAPDGQPAPAATPLAAPASAYLPPQAAPRASATGRTRRTWDVVLTIILLVLGLFGMSIGLIYAVILTDPTLVAPTLEAQGFDTDLVDFGAFSSVVAISHVLLYLVTLGVSIPLLVRSRIVVFWIPLTAGVIAAGIFWIGLFAALLPAAPMSYPA